MKKEIIGIFAVVGTIACIAFLSTNSSLPEKTSFFQRPYISDTEEKFIQFIVKHRKRYGTKEEYTHRLNIFK